MVSLINLVSCLTMCCFLYTLGLCDGGLDDINIVTRNIIDDDRYPCLIGDYDYEDALGKGILFYEGQRSGKLPADQRVRWRGDSALSDGQSDKATLVGGYYDAGDNVKFGWPMAFTITLLSWSAIEFQKEISSANQLSYLHRAIQWGTDFFLEAHDVSSTTLYTQVGDANRDHQCWERPEDMDTPRTLYKITASSPGTEAAAETAAALAAASVVFEGVDSRYSARLLNRAESLFEFGDKHRGSYQASCPFYCSFSGYQDELLWAAAWLYKATRSAKYLNYVVSNQGWSSAVSELSWDNKDAGAQVLLAKEYLGGNQDLKRFKSDADSFVCALMPGSSSVQIKTTPGGLLYTRDAGNLQYVTGASMLLVIYAKSLASSTQIKCGSKAFGPSQLESFAKSQIDYILGNNPMNMSYMVGFGTKYPQQPHHRGASIPSIPNLPSKVGCDLGYTNWYSSQKPNPNVHVGAIVGGPDSSDRFSDVRSDYAHLEPTTYLNAGFVGAVAGVMASTVSGVRCAMKVV